MKVVSPAKNTGQYLLPSDRDLPVTRDLTLRGYWGTPESKVGTSCIRCVDQPCISYGDLNQTTCPTNSIYFDNKKGFPSVDDTCNGCGVCVLRCPIGAIELGSKAQILTDSTTSMSLASPQDQMDWIISLKPAAIDDATTRAIALSLAQRTLSWKADVFYPYVASLFRLLDIPATASDRGNNNHRIDVLLSSETNPIAVEVKSPTETRVITIESVQQALENKLLVSRGRTESSLNGASSLVVAYEFPADRSKVREIVELVHNTFGVKIGLVALPNLLNRAIRNRVTGDPTSRQTFEQLLGELV